jgi:PH (Pleckstrin Homology) domain-containing protein/putative oligomerization/nucleic acid binding protein
MRKQKPDNISIDADASLTASLAKKDAWQARKISKMLNPDERIILVAIQSRIRPGGSLFTPNVIYATDRRIIIRDPYMLGIKENIVDIPYDIITSLKLERGLLSSTIKFKAPGLVSPTRMGMMDSIADGKDNDQGGIIEAIPKDKAEDLLEIIRSGMIANHKKTAASEQQPFRLSEEQQATDSNHYLQISISDELRKLAELRSDGILTEQEFQHIKQELIRKVNRT